MNLIIKMTSPPFIAANVNEAIPSFCHQNYFLMVDGQMTLVFDSMDSLDFWQTIFISIC